MTDESIEMVQYYKCRKCERDVWRWENHPGTSKKMRWTWREGFPHSDTLKKANADVTGRDSPPQNVSPSRHAGKCERDVTRRVSPPRHVKKCEHDMTGRVSPPQHVENSEIDMTGRVSPPWHVETRKLRYQRG